MKKLTLFIGLQLLILSGLQAKQTAFNVDHMLATKRIGAAAVSHDGKKMVFSVKTVDALTNKTETDLWLYNLTSADIKQLTFTPRAESSYQWSKDNSHVIYSRDRNIWKLPLDGTKVSKIKTLPIQIDTLKNADDGIHFAFTSRVPPSCLTLDCVVDYFKQQKSLVAEGLVYDQLFVRHWDRWGDGLRSHLFVGNFETDEIVDVTLGWDADVPSTPFGSADEYTFSADSSAIYFASRKQGRKQAWSTNFDIFRFDLNKNQSKPINLTEQNKAWDTLPVTSNNGKYLAYLAMDVPGYEADKFSIKLLDLETGKTKALTKEWDRSIEEMVFTDDSKYLIVTVQNIGNRSIYQINVSSGKRKLLVRRGNNSAIATNGKQLIYSHNNLKAPTEIYKLPISGGKPQQLTLFNNPLLSKVAMGSYQQFSFKGWNGETVYGYVIKPANYQSGKKYPMAFMIHGGPQGSFYNQFHYRWNPQIYAGAGYAVVMIDFHGSKGYGQAFTDSIQGDWGGKPLVDLKKGFAKALQKFSFIDKQKACALGASYGGYMINWIAGEWNDGFDCLINHDGIFDNRMMYYSTEELWFPEREHKGPQFDFPANYEKHNPINNVKYWKTPMLVIHGGLDYRIPESQAIGTFTALQRQNIPSKLLFFKKENHWVLKPANSKQWHLEVLKWMDTYLKNPE
jgi:dipeptidyl aminopeptidase/acylaminoacyl peptidase